MSNQIHEHPSECLPFLEFQCSDGGRNQYFENVLRTEIPDGIQDCSVIAVSLACTFDETVEHPEFSYAEALGSLKNQNSRLKPWRRKRPEESSPQYWARRGRELIAGLATVRTPKYKDPIYGTITHTYSACLQRRGYTLVFGGSCETRTFCLCTAKRKLVIDGYSVIRGIDRYDTAHVTVVQEGTVKGPTDISHGYFKVIHVWQRVY